MVDQADKRHIVLASSSPRRKELMALSGIPFEVFTADIDEACEGAVQERVMQIAQRKALAAATKFPNEFILAADTLVFMSGKVLGKPTDELQARQMLQMLSGQSHKVYTGVCIINGISSLIDTRYDETTVIFSGLDDKDIDGYIASGEPMDKAGAYAVQGMGGMFVESLSGSYSNVIGLPMALVRRMLIENGFMIF